MFIPIEITARDIKLGTKGIFAENSCAVGRAIKRALGLRGKKAERLIVSDETLDYPTDDEPCGDWVTLAIFPKQVREAIERIDNGEAIEPFTFNLNVNKSALAKVEIALP